MPYLHSPPCTFLHPSQAAHTVPNYRGRTDARQPLDLPDRTTRSSSVASNMSGSGSLRGFYEHEEYERIQTCLVERVESLRRMVVTFPAYNTKLRACEQQLEECREKLAKAHERFATKRDDQRSPNMGESDDEDVGVHAHQGTLDIVPKLDAHAPIQDGHSQGVACANTEDCDDEGLRIAPPQAVRTDELQYLSAALLECHSTTDAGGVPYMTAQPTIVWLQDKQRWAEIRCNHCGTQSHQGEPIQGMEGMLRHARTSHPQNQVVT